MLHPQRVRTYERCGLTLATKSPWLTTLRARLSARDRNVWRRVALSSCSLFSLELPAFSVDSDAFSLGAERVAVEPCAEGDDGAGDDDRLDPPDIEQGDCGANRGEADERGHAGLVRRG